MCDLCYRLGTKEASEALIKDLYVDLRTKVNKWSQITLQTPQARMGYIGQHLVSVVTGFVGGRSGARGYDLIIPDDKYGEIKTCYRVDQLGMCKDCNSPVSSIETECSRCGSRNIERKDDSKWLIVIRNDNEFSKILAPFRYYFVLFELDSSSDNDVVALIWEVDPKSKGFAFCMMDYYLNIRTNSKSKAPFNMWPYELKFLLTKPLLIYRSIIHMNGEIETILFPGCNEPILEELEPLDKYSSAKTLGITAVTNILSRFEEALPRDKKKKEYLQILESKRAGMDYAQLVDMLVDEIYLPKILSKKDMIPQELKESYPELQ